MRWISVNSELDSWWIKYTNLRPPISYSHLQVLSKVVRKNVGSKFIQDGKKTWPSASVTQKVLNIWYNSVSTPLRLEAIFNDGVITNLQLSLAMTEFWKSLSVNIWQSYGKEYSSTFLANVNSRSRSLCCRPSVCLSSVTLLRRT